MRSVLTLERYELKLLQTYRLGWAACAARMPPREADINLKREKQLRERERERRNATNSVTKRETSEIDIVFATWHIRRQNHAKPIKALFYTSSSKCQHRRLLPDMEATSLHCVNLLYCMLCFNDAAHASVSYVNVARFTIFDHVMNVSSWCS